MLTHKELKRRFHYNTDTGEFIYKIKTTRNDIGSIAGYKNAKGYLYVMINGHQCRLNRLAFFYMTGNWPKNHIDHINGIRHDNRWCNLREVNNSENQRNTCIQKNNKSGVVGVHLHKPSGKWVAEMKTKTFRRIKKFENYDDAVSYRKQLEKENNYHENHGRKNNEN